MKRGYGLALAALLWGAGACTNEEIKEEALRPRGEGLIEVEIEGVEESRALFGEQDATGDWHLAYSPDDKMLLWEVAEVTSRGYRYLRTWQPAQANLSEDGLSAAFTYAVPTPYGVGESYPETSNYTIERVYYTGILPREAFAGFWANYPVNDVDPTLTEASEGFLRLDVPREQTPTATSPDPKAILLRAADRELPEDGVVRSRFSHLLAYMKITVKGLPAGYDFQQLQIGGDSRISFANDWNASDKYCKYSLEDGFAATSRGTTLILHTADLEPDAEGNYTVWAACKPFTGSGEATPAFTPYSSANQHIESKLVTVTRTGKSSDGGRAIALEAGRVAIFTLNYGYGNDLTAPELSASSENVDAERSRLIFSWPTVGGADHYCYTIDGGEVQQTTACSVELEVAPSTPVRFAVKACPTEESGYVESGWSEISITAEPYRRQLVMSEIDEGDVLSYQATLLWQPVEGAAGFSYKIGAEGAEVKIGNVTTYTFTDLQPESYYSIFLRALAADDSAEYRHSEWVEKLILTSPKEPLQMGPVTIAAVSERTVTAIWEPIEGAVGYHYRLNNGIEEEAVSGQPITGLTAATAYTLQIRALAAVASDWSDSDWSEAVSFTTPEAAGPLFAWGSEEFAAWALELGTTTLNADGSYAGLGYCLGSGKGYEFVTEDSTTYLKSLGSADKGKNYLYFSVEGKGRLIVRGYNNKTKDKTMRIMLNKATLGEDISLTAKSDYTITLDISASPGDQVMIAPRDSDIFIYSIAWEAE